MDKYIDIEIEIPPSRCLNKKPGDAGWTCRPIVRME